MPATLPLRPLPSLATETAPVKPSHTTGHSKLLSSRSFEKRLDTAKKKHAPAKPSGESGLKKLVVKQTVGKGKTSTGEEAKPEAGTPGTGEEISHDKHHPAAHDVAADAAPEQGTKAKGKASDLTDQPVAEEPKTDSAGTPLKLAAIKPDQGQQEKPGSDHSNPKQDTPAKKVVVAAVPTVVAPIRNADVVDLSAKAIASRSLTGSGEISAKPDTGETTTDATATSDKAGSDSGLPTAPTFGVDVNAPVIKPVRRDGTGSGASTSDGTNASAAAAQKPVANDAFAAAFDQAVASFKSAPSDAENKPVTGVDTITAAALVSQPATQHQASVAKSVAAAPTDPAPRFVEENHPKIVSGIVGQLMPTGGKLQIQLNPPDLGPMQINVEIENGTVSAGFQTTNGEATKLLSHSLGQLKSTLEAGGLNVEKLHVEQSPKKQDAQADSDTQRQAPHEQQQQAQREKQRKELMDRMWRRLNGVGDPLDTLA